jgi:hypothetical protein
MEFLTIEERKQVYDLTLSAFNLEAMGKEILSASEYKECKEIADNALGNERVQKLLSNGKAEVSIYSEIGGTKVKGRIDFLSENFILDLKTCQSCTEKNFQSDFVNYLYHVKLAFYQLLAEQETGEKLPVLVLACESSEDKDFQIYQIDQDFLDIGLVEFHKMLLKYQTCVQDNEWPSLPKNIQTLFAPAWLLK